MSLFVYSCLFYTHLYKQLQNMTIDPTAIGISHLKTSCNVISASYSVITMRPYHNNRDMGITTLYESWRIMTSLNRSVVWFGGCGGNPIAQANITFLILFWNLSRKQGVTQVMALRRQGNWMWGNQAQLANAWRLRTWHPYAMMLTFHFSGNIWYQDILSLSVNKINRVV